MQKKTKWITGAVVLAVLLLAGAACLLFRPASETPATSAASASVASEETASSPESTAPSESTVASSAQPSPVQSETSEAAVDPYEENGAESVPDSEGTSDAADPDSRAASQEAASSAAHSAAASSHPASSSQAASSAGSVTSDSIASLESLGDERINEYIREIQNLQKRSQRQLYQTMNDAYNQYMEYPVEKRTLTLKVTIVLGKTAELTPIQNQCDKEFKATIKELRSYLKENGYDQSIADAAEAEYQEKKDAMTKELTSLTYSQVTGSGDGSHWLIEHYDEMMGE